VVDEIELQLQQRSGREVKSAEIGELVLEQLSSMSEVAYVRFASVYRQFQSVSDFVATLEGLNRRVSRPSQEPGSPGSPGLSTQAVRCGRHWLVDWMDSVGDLLAGRLTPNSFSNCPGQTAIAP
jgi:hypothetical protein